MNRLLGASEHSLWLLAQAIPTNVTLCAQITGTLTNQQLTVALAKVQQRHPLLAVKIVIDYDRQPRFVSEDVPNIPLRVIERQGEEHWCQEIEEELIRPFSWSDGPLIRVVFLQSFEVSELIVTINHCIGDGLSLAYLIKDILHEVSEPGTLQPQQCLTELPPCEELLPFSTHELNRDFFDKDFHLPKITQSDLETTKHYVSQKENLGKIDIGLLHWYLLPKETARLVLCCREKQTSVHGALCASFLLAMAKKVKSADEVLLKCISPLNLRHYLQPPIGEDFGVYFTREVTHHQIKPATSDFWEVAREVKYQINQVIKHNKTFASVLKTKDFLSTKPDPVRLSRFVQEVMKGLRGSDLTVTNLGHLNIPNQFGSLHLRELYITVAGVAPIIVGVVTLGGKLFVCNRYVKTFVSKEYAGSINEDAQQILHKVIAAS
ncbi:phthiocerol/phthiodiolone dimycocerosyl transferase family protein [Nostoc sp.]|uniref:phthiocerol/phthiodiolone dimycocerosyl transferase family protein n=1 Tax=Nostoc sp. TaxID=1180 RepID=UPI002FF78FD2